MTSFDADAGDPYELLSTPIPSGDLVDPSGPSGPRAGGRPANRPPSAVRVGFGVGQAVITVVAAGFWMFAALVVAVSLGLPNSWLSRAGAVGFIGVWAALIGLSVAGSAALLGRTWQPWFDHRPRFWIALVVAVDLVFTGLGIWLYRTA